MYVHVCVCDSKGGKSQCVQTQRLLFLLQVRAASRQAGVYGLWHHKPHAVNVKMCTALKIFSAAAKFAIGISQ